MDSQQVKLKNGDVITVTKPDFDGWLQIKDVLARVAEKATHEGIGTDGTSLAFTALRVAGRDEILDLLVALTHQERPYLIENFRPLLLVKAIQVALDGEFDGLGEMLGEVLSSPGSENSAMTPSSTS